MFLILTVFKWSFSTVLINTLKLLKLRLFFLEYKLLMAGIPPVLFSWIQTKTWCCSMHDVGSVNEYASCILRV